MARTTTTIPLVDPVNFAVALREQGVEVPPAAVIAFVAALGVVGVDRPDDVYWAGRATLLRRHEDVVAYDAAFGRTFLGIDDDAARRSSTPDAPPATTDPLATPARPDEVGGDFLDASDADDAAADDRDETPIEAVRWSRLEVLRRRDFAECAPEELEELWAALALLRLGGSQRRSRRRRPARRGTLDLRRTVRASLRNGGEPVRRAHRAPTVQPRRVVLLVDVSGSMEPYARALLRFGNAAVQSGRPVEVFAFATRLTRLTGELATRDPDAALRHASSALVDLSGGTRLGEVMAEFNRHHGIRGTARGADVVVLSDGWDRGEPATLAREMARLHRVAHRVIWVNPLKASPGYAPLAGGMAAALPFVDRFVEGHSLGSLEAVAGLLAAGGG